VSLCTHFSRTLMVLTLTAVMSSAANAFLLSTQANNDPRPSPIGSPSNLVVVSGSATAIDNGIPNQYPGKVVCRGSGTCNFGPVASAIQTGGYRFVIVMSCVTEPSSLCSNGTDVTVPVNSSMTWDQAIAAWRSRYGSSVSRYNAFTYPTGGTRRMCTSWASFSFNNNYLLPGADSCGPPPIPPNQCNVGGGPIVLDHGPLKVGEITGKTVEVTRQITCTRTADVMYTLASGNPINLGNGVLSTLSINGVNVGLVTRFPGGTSNFKITSTLTDQGAVAGPFSKTIVLIQYLL
jgi:hypothetical protein